MESFSTISSIQISIFDRNLHTVRAASDSACSFCSDMRRNAAFCAKCDQSNMEAFRIAEQTRAPYFYQCHAGIYELVIPIISKDHLLGFLMVGQFVPAEKKEYVWQSVVSRCMPYGLPLPDREKFFSECRILSQEEILAWAQMAQACTSYICVKQYITSKTDRDFLSVEQYIEKHIEEPISIEQVCRATDIPRNRLYDTVKRNTGFTAGEYIWLVRINKAKEMLTETDLPVSEIAGKLGLEDGSYFSKVFRRIVGTSPSRYRRQRGYSR